jgi:thiol:disulfide interchange protein
MRSRSSLHQFGFWHGAGFLLTLLLVMAAPAQQSFKDLLEKKGNNAADRPARGPKKAPADVKVELVPGQKPATVDLVISVTTPPDAWIYAINPLSGPDTSIKYTKLEGLEPAKPSFAADRESKVVNVPEFAVGGDSGDVEKFIGGVVWTQTFHVSPEATHVAVEGQISYQVCDDANCKFGKTPIEVALDLPGAQQPHPSPVHEPQGLLSAGPVVLPPAQQPNQKFDQLSGPRGKEQLAVTSWRIGVDQGQVQPGDRIKVLVQVDLAPEWHIYSFDQGLLPDESGPNRTIIELTDTAGLTPLDPQFYGPAPHEKPSTEYAGLIEKTWEGKVTFEREFEVPATTAPGPLLLKGKTAWQACDAHICKWAGFEFEIPLDVVAADGEPQAGPALGLISQTLRMSDAQNAIAAAPVVAQSVRPPRGVAGKPERPGAAEGPGQQAADNENPKVNQAAAAETGSGEDATRVQVSNAGRGVDKSQGLPLFLGAAVLAGFASLLTPCVFPMVPITVSFFQKQSEQKHHRPVVMALVYCLGIVATFTVLGLVMSMLFGAASLNTLANNPWLNLFIAAVMVFFGFNLLGLFEITIPGWLLSYSSGQESRGGYIGVLFMALTFTLTSFTCTFAFVGGLLGMAASGDRLWPLLGLLAFSAAFSLPFFFLALFPSWLKKLPRAGGWMNTVKVIMGLLEIGAAFKFLSVADWAWNPKPLMFDYELVISAWLVISLTATMYLLGLFRLPHDTASDHVGVMRLFSAMSFLGLAAYLAVGLYGGRKPDGKVWELVSAFAPPRFESEVQQEGEIGPAQKHGELLYALDYVKALEYARRNRKPVFLEFTGVNCVNCRKMEQGPLSSPEVIARLKDFVCVQLWCDQVPGVADSTERARLLQQNVALQEGWFEDTTLPAYVVVPPEPDLLKGRPGAGILAEKLGYDPNPTQFAKFLNDGLNAWQREQGKTLIGQSE